MHRASAQSGVNWDQTGIFADRTSALYPPEHRELIKDLERPDMISFADDVPDPALVPVDVIAQATSRIMGDAMRRAEVLQYASSEGYAPLREWLVGTMSNHGVPCTIENIVITNGSQQALDLLAKLFLDAGDTVLTTAPTSCGALQAFNAYESAYAAISFNSQNRAERFPNPAITHLTPDFALPPKFAYIAPDFANPTGETLSLAEREYLLTTLADLNLPVIEDGTHHALRFEGASLPSLLALDIGRTGHIDRSRVIYVGTFSTTIAPGLRVGWICAAQEVIRKVALARRAADLYGSALDQAIVHDVVSAAFREHLQRILTIYQSRRDTMLRSLERFMPGDVSWTRPDGGMFIWLTLPAGIDSTALLRESLDTVGVIFEPGPSSFADGSGEQHLRLNFTHPGEPKIVEGIRRLGNLVGQHLARPRTRRASEMPSPVLTG